MNLDDSVMSGFNVLETSVLDEVWTLETSFINNGSMGMTPIIYII